MWIKPEFMSDVIACACYATVDSPVPGIRRKTNVYK